MTWQGFSYASETTWSAFRYATETFWFPPSRKGSASNTVCLQWERKGLNKGKKDYYMPWNQYLYWTYGFIVPGSMLRKAFCGSSWRVRTERVRDSVGTLRNVNPLVFPSFISCQSAPPVRGDCLVTLGVPRGLEHRTKCTEFQEEARNLMILLQGPCTRPMQSCASTYQLPCISDSKWLTCMSKCRTPVLSLHLASKFPAYISGLEEQPVCPKACPHFPATVIHPVEDVPAPDTNVVQWSLQIISASAVLPILLARESVSMCK